MEEQGNRPSLAAMMRELVEETSRLVRQQINLARTEVHEKVQQLAAGIKAIVIGGAMLLVGLVYILDAVVYGIARLVPGYYLWLGALLVGIATFVAALFLLKRGIIGTLTNIPVPSRSTASIKRDVQVVSGRR